ncbi:PTS sugar transporter subunit IIA [bacterium]|nr:MAG: PTS sugar transporter subunit IIA [bacterium]RKZ24957.1 MAG: PTS sugar transporter subunit IIA [bacterium]
MKDVFKPEFVKLELEATTREEVLRELVDLLPVGDDKKELIYQRLLERENLGTTGIGKGIAIPHSRTLALKDVFVIVGRSKKGVDFNALDGKPVHLFFLIVAPPYDPKNRYLITLGKIAEISRELTRKKEWMEIEKKEEFVKFLNGLLREKK